VKLLNAGRYILSNEASLIIKSILLKNIGQWISQGDCLRTSKICSLRIDERKGVGDG